MKSAKMAFGAIINNNKKIKQKLRAERHKTEERVGFIGDGVYGAKYYTAISICHLCRTFSRSAGWLEPRVIAP